MATKLVGRDSLGGVGLMRWKKKNHLGNSSIVSRIGGSFLQIYYVDKIMLQETELHVYLNWRVLLITKVSSLTDNSQSWVN